MDKSKASDQQDLAGVAETTQPPQVQPPIDPSAPPVRRKPATPRSQSERLLGVKDPEPELTERPVGRKRAPKSKPESDEPTWFAGLSLQDEPVQHVDLEWDPADNPLGAAIAAKLAGGAE